MGCAVIFLLLMNYLRLIDNSEVPNGTCLIITSLSFNVHTGEIQLWCLVLFFWGFFFCSVQVFCCVAASRNWSCRTNHAFALLMKWLATGKATPKQGTIMFQQNSVQGLFLLLFFKCILGSGCFYCCQKVASLESWTCGCNRVSFVDQLVLLPYVCYSFDFYMHLHKWRKK